MSWYPDPEAVVQDALLQQWDNITYLFPPIPLLLKVLKIVQVQKIRAIVICPRWPTALWWTVLEGMMVEPPLQLPHYQEALLSVQESKVKPYMEPLIAAHILGKSF